MVYLHLGGHKCSMVSSVSPVARAKGAPWIAWIGGVLPQAYHFAGHDIQVVAWASLIIHISYCIYVCRFVITEETAHGGGSCLPQLVPSQ